MDVMGNGYQTWVYLMENVHDEVQKETLVHRKVIFVKISESNALWCSRV